MSDGDPSSPALHSGATSGIRHPRGYRTERHLIYEAADGRSYRIALARLCTHADILRILQWLSKQEGVTLTSIDHFIEVASNAAGLPQP